MYDFLLAIITNLPPILHRFRDSLRDVQNRYIWLPLLHVTTQRWGSPGTISVRVHCQGTHTYEEINISLLSWSQRWLGS